MSTLLLFDIDGTLLRTGGAGKRAFNAVFQSLWGRTIFEGPAAEVPYAGRTDPCILEDLTRALGIASDEWQQRFPEFQTAYYQALTDDLATQQADTVEGVTELMRALSEYPEVHLGLLTGNLEQGARIKLDPFGLNEFFPVGGFGSDHRDRGEVARIAKERSDQHFGRSFNPDRTIVIGDTVHDMACAEVNRFRKVGLAETSTPAADLWEAGAEHVVTSLTPTPELLSALLDGS